MDGIQIEVTGNIARVIERPARITAGTVGLPIEFSFDNQWEGLSKTAVFRAGRVEKIAENLESETTVPWEVTENPNVWLSVGVYGVNADGSEAIPTIWANVCTICDGVNPDGDASTAPTLPVWQRLWNAIGNLLGLTTNAKGNLVEAINEVNKIALAGGIECDTTLTQSGKAADAKATGDAIKGLTASDVGARPNTWMPTASDVGARPNTWMPTASDVGAAPAGDYATKNYVSSEIEKAQLSGDGSEIDLSGYATKDDLDNLTASDVGAAKTIGLGTYSGDVNTVGDGGVRANSVVWISDAINIPGNQRFGLLETWEAQPGAIVQRFTSENGDVFVREYFHNGFSQGWNLDWQRVDNKTSAPAGHGLGENAVSKGTPDHMSGNGFYFASVTEPATGYSGNTYGEHIQYNENYAYQRMIGMKASTGITEGTVRRRYKDNGVWSAFEYENPPMLLGVEYRTTERYNGKVVYAKHYSAGKFVNNGYFSIPSGAVDVIRYAGYFGEAKRLLPIGRYADPGSNYYAYLAKEVSASKVIYTYQKGFTDGANDLLVTVYYTKE